MKEMVTPSEFTAVELTTVGDKSNDEGKESENVTNEQNGTKCEEEGSFGKRSISDRVASFFRFARKDSSSGNLDNVEQGLNNSKGYENGTIDNVEHDKKLETSNGTKDHTDASEEKKGEIKPDVEEASSNEMPIRFSKFLKLFKRSSPKNMEKLEEAENEKDPNDEEEQQKEHQEEDKSHEENDERKVQLEFEPETKPSSNVANQDEMQTEQNSESPKLSGSPKNTAV